MPDCPKCHQFVDSQAIECPYCRTLLKAHGHPGMTLHRSTNGEPLCHSCVYHEDDTCTFPKRPYAMDCTLYRDRSAPDAAKPTYSEGFRVKTWVSRNLVWIVLIGLIVISLLVAML